MIRPVIGLPLICAVTVTAVAAQEVLRRTQATEETRASWIIGAHLISPNGESIGPIDDLLINEDDGTVSAAIVSVGGFLGFGSKAIAVDWNELQIAYDGNEITLPLTREEADEAQEFGFRERQLPPAPADPLPPAGGGGLGGGVP